MNQKMTIITVIFIRNAMHSAVLQSVHMSVHLSVTTRYPLKMAKLTFCGDCNINASF